RHYHFVTKEAFENEISEGRLLEYAEVHGNLYGTSRAQIERITEGGRDVILEIDVQGAEAVMQQVPTAVSIFILPPSFETLRARLTARATEGSNDLDVRLRNSHYEVSRYSHFKYVIINDEVHTAAGKLASIVVAERQLRDRQSDSIQGILDSFERSNA
ncbi:MAG TPA: guanylate kinase, partial [Pyrinomonadaceae bacterium]|nr:guanylate kinase [Pyrinomonadaceae bacterium]